MDKVISNPSNLTDNDVDSITNKVRAIILNDLNIIIVDYGNILMFPGGKVEVDEKDNEALKRELKEELGLDLEDDMIIPFIEYHSYIQNYSSRNGNMINRLVKTKYFIVRTNKKVNLSNNSLSESEIDELFKVIEKNVLNINSFVSYYDSNNPRWRYFKKELMDILFELRAVFKTELENAARRAVMNPDSWKEIPDSAVYLDNNEIRLIKTDKKVGDYS